MATQLQAKMLQILYRTLVKTTTKQKTSQFNLTDTLRLKKEMRFLSTAISGSAWRIPETPHASALLTLNVQIREKSAQW